MSFSSDHKKQTPAEFGQLVAGIARLSKGKLTAQGVKALLGDSPNGRTHKEIRQAVTDMCVAFPKSKGG